MSEKNRTAKSGWRWVKFGDLVQLSKARSKDPLADGFDRYIGLEHLESGDLRVRSWGSTADGVTFTNVFKPGQVLFGKRRAYQRKVAVPDFAGVCSGDIYVLEPKDTRILLPELLPYLCQTDAFFEHAVDTSAGSLSPRTSWTQLASFPLPLPPLDTQASLLEALSAVEESNSACRDALDAAEALLRSVFCEAFTRGTRGSALKVTPFGSIPRNWEVLPLGEAYEVQLGKKLYREFTEGDGQVPYLRNANVQWNRLDLSDVATMTFSCKERDLYELRYGDILACEGRHVGKAAMWRDEVPGACYQMALHRLRRRSPRHAPGYLLHCLRYYSISGRFRAVTGETTIPHLPAEAFKRMLFPFPPTDEQEEIANLIDGVYASIESANARLKSTQALLRGLLQVLHPGGQ